MLENRYLFPKFPSVLYRIKRFKPKVFFAVPDASNEKDIMNKAFNFLQIFALSALPIVAASCGSGDEPSPNSVSNGIKVEKIYTLDNVLSGITYDNADSSLTFYQSGVYSSYGVNAMAVIKVSASQKAEGGTVEISSPIFDGNNLLGLGKGTSSDSRTVKQPPQPFEMGASISAEGFDLAASTDGKFRIKDAKFKDNAMFLVKNIDNLDQLKQVFENKKLRWKLQKNPDSNIKGIGTDNTIYLIGLVKHVE